MKEKNNEEENDSQTKEPKGGDFNSYYKYGFLKVDETTNREGA
jgi:hypothetical protein